MYSGEIILSDKIDKKMNAALQTKLSVLLPVRNEGKSLKIMVQMLEATIEVPHEILVIYDFPEDDSVEATKWLQRKYQNVYLVLNDLGPGVVNAVRKGISQAKGEVVLISAVDEVFPIAAIGDMLELIDAGCDLVSCTRYARGGRRLGGSLVGGLLSRMANWLFRSVTGSVLSDATTGIKMMHKSIFDSIKLESNPVGWSFAFEVSIKAQLLGLKVGETPVLSVDRPFGGQSSFKLGPWVTEYMRWFLWGAKRLNRSTRRQKEPITISSIREE